MSDIEKQQPNYRFAPVDDEVRNETVRHLRSYLYAPDDSPEFSYEVLKAAGCLDSLALVSCQAVMHYQAGDAAYVRYENLLVDRFDITGSHPLLTQVTVDNTVYRSPAIVREEYRVGLGYFDFWGDPLGWTNYRLRKYVGGSACLDVKSSFDGMSEALRHEDALFLRATQWREGTIYDAEALTYEALRLLGLPNYEADAGKMV